MQSLLKAGFLLSFILLMTCSDDEPKIENSRVIVATIDELELSETSFQRAYLPVLLYGDKFDSRESREEVINFLIGQKLLSQVALEAGLDTSAAIQSTRDQVEQKAMSRQLYQQWVRAKLDEPTEEALRTGFLRGHKSLFTRHLFSKSEAEIHELHNKLKIGNENFYTLAQDVFSDTTLSKNGGALGWITFGDLDEALEDILFTLKPGQISAPVESQYGWHILTIDDSREELLRDENEYLKNRDLIYNKISERRENVLGKQVLNDFMAQHKIEFNREVTAQVWPLVIARLAADNLESKSPQELTGAGANLESLRDETLLTVNSETWRVADILERLPGLDRSLLYGNLYIAASNIIRDEMLAREARKANLHEHPDVVEEVKDVYDQLLADAYVNLIADTLTFRASEQENYFLERRLKRYHAPDSLLVELFVFPDSLVATKALYQLRNGVIATNPADKQLWIDSEDMESPLYRLSRTLSPGTMAGPIPDGTSWVLTRLIERRRSPLLFSDVQEQVLADMENERFNTTRNILVNQLRPSHHITINHVLLNR